MRRFALVLAICLPSLTHALDRFSDWVARELGFDPHYAQSIGWDMPEASVTLADPLQETAPNFDFVATPETTAWVVGILNASSEARLTGLALVWSDAPFDSAARLGSLRTQSGFVAFQTPQQTWVSQALPQDIATKMNELSPGPILATQPDGTFFPVGDTGVSDGCLEITALYTHTKDLAALVVLFQSGPRDDAADVTCATLTS